MVIFFSKIIYLYFSLRADICKLLIKRICYRYFICILSYICYYVICECIIKSYELMYILVYILLNLGLSISNSLTVICS